MLPWATGVFGSNYVYVQDNAVPHTARDTAAFWTNRMLKSWTGQLGAQTCTRLSMFGINSQSGSETWMTPFHRN